MTVIEDILTKLDAKFNAVSDVMAKKRKLYLLKRVKSLNDNIGVDSSAVTNISSPLQYENVCTKPEGDTSTSQSKSNSLSKCSFQNCHCTFVGAISTFDIKKNDEQRYNYENNPSLRSICNESNRLDNTSQSLNENNNCSCNKNCHNSRRLLPPFYHHQDDVLKNKSAQKSSASHHNNNNNNNGNNNNDKQEIHMQNSYYLLRNFYQLNSPLTDKIMIGASCAAPLTKISNSAISSTKTTSVRPRIEIVPIVRTSEAHGTCRSMSEITPNSKSLPHKTQFSTCKVSRRKFIWQFWNIFMILKTLLDFVTKIPSSLLSVCQLSIGANKSKVNDNSYIRVNERPALVKDQQQYRHCNKQKSPNVSFTKMALLSFSFFSISFTPLAQALTFETTLQSSLAALDRSPRDIDAVSEIKSNETLLSEHVRLAQPEHVCKSLDIRNTASQFQQLENCTVIEGFLLITLLSGNSMEDYNGTFPMLTEITDFIVVYQVHYLRSIGRIFPNLSVIRGRVLFDGYALIVYSNSHLEEIGLSKLTTISRGGVRIEKNVMLCFVKSIDWSEIVSNTTDIVIEENRDAIECPACPGDQWSVGDSAGPNDLVCKERHGHRYCWNSKSCQKFCPKRCRNNCVNENTCCNEACLGGCSSDNLNECISCRNFSIYNTTCIDKCPDNYYNYLDRRCLTAESCSIIGTKYENNQQEVLVAYKESCSTSCPEGYMKKNMTCIKCDDVCTKRCPGGVIDSMARAKSFHLCTHILESPLIINVKRGGRHLMEALADGLSSIINIKTSLKVQGTYGIFNLKFLKNLQVIEGETLIDDKYAFYVLENTDIESIWNPNQTVKILRGSVYFHFNPKLCRSEIDSLLPMLNQTSFDSKEVAEDSNGYMGTCNTSLLNVTITNLGSLFAVVRIDNPMNYEDDRTFIGYQFLHTEDPFGNVTKHDFRPCADKWDISAPSKDTSHLFANLKPYTKYSFYVKTLTISSEPRNAQSEIHNFKTKSDQPQNINKLQAYANSSYNIVMNWAPPNSANGKLINYKIRAVYDRSIQKIKSRNYCKDPLKEVSKPDIPVTITEKPTVPKNCNCKKINAQMYDDEEIDANIHASIELENSLQNFVYVKKEHNKNKVRNVNANELLDENTNRNRRAIEGDPSDSFLLRHIRDVPSKTNLVYDISITTPSTSTTILPTIDAHNEGTIFYNETRLNPTGEYYEVFVDNNVSASTTEYVFTKLKHFSWYMLGVEACREKDDEGDFLPDCSIEVKAYIRTLKLENVDRVEEFRAFRETTNSSRSNIRIFWERPTRPNGEVVSYTISYLLQSPDAVEEKKCITESDYIELGYQHSGYVLSNLNPGNYSIRISTNTIAGEGEYSKAIFIDIPPVTMPLSVIIGITVGSISAAFLIGVFTYYLCRRRILAPPSDLKIFPSVNPHYISLQYIPDNWEVARDKVIQLNSLGQGSFGMVYEGILKSDTDEDTPCAIKTVNENATDRERMNFLNEACVMKQFDTYHVVRLLGVCSRGQPALVIMELMKNGDLKSYLRAHRPDERDEVGMPVSIRSGISIQSPNISRIYQMAIEIADGMAYLAAKKFVHRDLAARNCMVAADLTVKIGDFGMTRDIYENDYYRKGTKGLLPVRWMPPESLRDGIYSTASDIFSYGVVLWEMATLAAQPYQGLSNDQVLRYVIDGGVMERPENCPDKLYSLMQKCWHHRPSARPTFMEIIRYLLEFSDPHFREVSFYHSEEGQQILSREIAERNQNSGDLFENHDNDMEDVTTPLRLEESSGYKLNMDNNSSAEHRGDSSMVIDEDDPHSTYSLTGSPIVVSSTPDEHVRNNFNMSRIINSHNQMLNSAPSTSAELRKTGSTISYYPHPHTHPHHRNLYQPTRYSQQQHQSRHNRSDDIDAYVPPDFELKDLMEIKRESDEQGYEMYDPSPNYSEKVPANVHDDDEDDLNIHSTAGQNLLSRSKQRQKHPTIMPLSSSMPDDVIGQPPPSALHPSTASAASSNTSSKTAKYPSLRAVADTLGSNVTAKFRSILFNTHKRSGSNASYKSTTSNPNSGTAVLGGGSGSSNNLIRGRGKSVSGQNLGTIESGGSGSAGSYCANPRFFTPNKPSGSATENQNYKRLDDGSSDALLNKSKIPTSSAFAMSSNPNYQVLDESLNTSGTSTSTNNPAISNSLLHTSENPNYQLMQPPATQKTENVSSYVMMNEPKGPKSSAISISNNPNYQIMGPPPPPSTLTGTTLSSVLPQAHTPVAGGAATGAGDRFTKYSSSSSAVSNSSNHETDEEDDDVPTPKGMKSDRIPLSRRSSNDRSQKKKHPNNRSRSQSSSSSSRSSNTATTTSQQYQQSSGNPTSSTASSTLLTKENWLKQQPTQPHHHSQPTPPPNGLVGREAS